MSGHGLREVRAEWQSDSAVDECPLCHNAFTFTRRKHHCRYCGLVVCDDCSRNRAELPAQLDYNSPQRVCDTCATILAEHGNKLEEEMLNVQFFLRNVPLYTLVHQMLEIGSRGPPDKSFFLVKDQSRRELIFEMMNTNAAVVSMSGSKAQRVTTALLKAMDVHFTPQKRLLIMLQHPFILPTHAVYFLEGKPKMIVVREFCPKGSLRDVVHHENPKHPYGRKYRRPGSAMNKQKIAKIGRQLLEALSFFKLKNYPVPHLHMGNVIVRDSGDVCITDYENVLLGQQPFYRDYGMDDVEPEVVCFGLILYHCAMGMPLRPGESIDAASQAASCPVPVYDVLRRIFQPPKGQPATVEQLLQLQFFAAVEVKADVRYMTQQPFDTNMNSLIKKARQTAPSLACTVPRKEPTGTDELAAKEKAEADEAQRRRQRKMRRDSKRVQSVVVPSAPSGFSFDAPATAKAAPVTTTTAPAPAPTSAAPAPRSRTSSTARVSAAPAPAPAPAAAPATRRGGPPPPPGPPPKVESIVGSDAPAPQPGRADLLAAIRNPANIRKLKKAS